MFGSITIPKEAVWNRMQPFLRYLTLLLQSLPLYPNACSISKSINGGVF